MEWFLFNLAAVVILIYFVVNMNFSERIDILIKENKRMSAQLDALQAAVAAESTVIDSAIALITGLAAQVEAAKNDPVAIAALVADVNAKAQALADAVKANTPA